MANLRDPLDEIAETINGLCGADSEMVAMRRAFLRVTGGLRPTSVLFAAIDEFQLQAAMASLMLALGEGKDLYQDRERLVETFAGLRKAIAQERARSLH
jgi:hypothetical protein